MAKRTATKELTDRNWDQDDEPEEAGQFIMASEDILKSRQIKKAKRRGSGGSEGGINAFSGFSGFKSTNVSASSSLTTNASASSSLTTNVSASSTTDVSFENKNTNSATAKSKSANGMDSSKSESVFLSNLKSLNDGVIEWVQQHVKKNPYCILTPIFNDYNKHLKELESEKGSPLVTGTTQTIDTTETKKTGLSFPTNGTTFSGFSFGATTGFKSAGTVATTNSFSSCSSGSGSVASFGSSSSSTFGTTASGVTSGFSFKMTPSGTAFANPSQSTGATQTAGASSLSFTSSQSSSAPLSFAAPTSSAPTSQDSTAAAGDDEYVPPVVELNEVKEDGAFHSKKCKLFYQKKGEWVERGVGNAHLKMADDRVQLIVRAGTNLGNIILNISLSEGIPVKRQGKNNVFFVCVPNPPFDSKATDNPAIPMLLRVKTAEDADEFVKQIEDKRK